MFNLKDITPPQPSLRFGSDKVKNGKKRNVHVGLPGVNNVFRVHPRNAHDAQLFYDNSKNQWHILSRNVIEEIDKITPFLMFKTPAKLFHAVDSQGDNFIIVIAGGNLKAKLLRTVREAQKNWVIRLPSDQEKGFETEIETTCNLSPRFVKNWLFLLQRAFENHYIDSIEHPLIKAALDGLTPAPQSDEALDVL